MVSKPSRSEGGQSKTGRPMGFDPEVAVSKAMRVFWEQGYEATSTTDLTSAMGLSRSSLYQTFGSKRELFIRSLDSYVELAANNRAAMGEMDSGREFLEGFFRGLIRSGDDGQRPKGCLLVNTACEFGGLDNELESYVEATLERTREMFQRVIERSQEAGEIPVAKDTRALSQFLVMSVCGLRVMAKLETDRSALDTIVDQIITHLD